MYFQNKLLFQIRNLPFGGTIKDFDPLTNMNTMTFSSEYSSVVTSAALKKLLYKIKHYVIKIFSFSNTIPANNPSKMTPLG